MNNNIPLFNLTVQQFIDIMNTLINTKLSFRKKRENQLEKLMSIKDVCKYFSISKPTIYKWVRLEILPTPLKIGGLVYFKMKDIEKVITKNN
jgi:excisionase family DNA binding protein